LSWPDADGSTGGAETEVAAATAAADFLLFTGDGGADDDFDFLEILLGGLELTKSSVSGLSALLAFVFCCCLVLNPKKRK